MQDPDHTRAVRVDLIDIDRLTQTLGDVNKKSDKIDFRYGFTQTFQQLRTLCAHLETISPEILSLQLEKVIYLVNLLESKKEVLNINHLYDEHSIDNDKQVLENAISVLKSKHKPIEMRESLLRTVGFLDFSVDNMLSEPKNYENVLNVDVLMYYLQRRCFSNTSMNVYCTIDPNSQLLNVAKLKNKSNSAKQLILEACRNVHKYGGNTICVRPIFNRLEGSRNFDGIEIANTAQSKRTLNASFSTKRGFKIAQASGIRMVLANLNDPVSCSLMQEEDVEFWRNYSESIIPITTICTLEFRGLS